jgi:hypothetical protein
VSNPVLALQPGNRESLKMLDSLQNEIDEDDDSDNEDVEL